MFKSYQGDLLKDSGWKKARRKPEPLLFYLLKNIQRGCRRWVLSQGLTRDDFAVVAICKKHGLIKSNKASFAKEQDRAKSACIN